MLFARRPLALAAAVLLLIATPLFAADDGAKKPYQLRVVVRFAKHPDLNAVFRERVERQLRDSLQAAIGELGKVQVVTQHKLLPEIAARGLQPAVEAWNDVSDVTTHFVLIDYHNWQYEIQTMRHDGWTGLSGPVVRHAKTNDRLIVARTAALLIDRDLGIAGTLQLPPKGEEVRVALRGGGLGVPLARWVEPEDVFAVARIEKTAQGLRSTRVDGALLQVVAAPEADGACRCKLLHRWRDPVAAPAIAYRCVKLGTTKAPLRMRVYDPKTQKGLPAVQVWVAQEGFAVKPQETLSTDSDGYAETKDAYAHLAYVKLLTTGASPRATIPVEVLEDHTALLPLFADEKADALGQLDLQRSQLDRQLTESVEVVTTQFNELNQLKEHQPRRQKAQAILDGLKQEIEARAGELRSLAKQAEQQGITDKRFLQNEEIRLDILRKHQGRLEGFIQDLDAALAKQADPAQKHLLELAGTAKQQLASDDYAGAIETYKQIVAAAPANDRKAYEEQLKRLQARWEPKGEAHAKARKYIYEEWPKPKDPVALKEALPLVRKAFNDCRAAKDYLTPRKLISVNNSHSAQLLKQGGALKPDNKDDSELLKVIAEDSDQLSKFIVEVTEYLKQAPTN